MRKKAGLAGLGLILVVTLAAAPAPKVSGPELAQRLGCWACHSLEGRGGRKSVPLDHIGARLSPKELEGAIKHLRSRRPRGKMPSYAHLRSWEMQTLVDYLQTLK
ncbi:MAG: cytochrome c [Syntrophales bacterium]|nr:cytochrome c [Syntrophales bacterium]